MNKDPKEMYKDGCFYFIFYDKNWLAHRHPIDIDITQEHSLPRASA
jgi:hypothetical protein